MEANILQFNSSVLSVVYDIFVLPVIDDISVHSETYGKFIILDAPSVLHLKPRACNVCTCRPHAVSCSPNAIHHGTPATNLLTAPQVGKPHPSVTCPCSGGRNLAPLRSNSLGEKSAKMQDCSWYYSDRMMDAEAERRLVHRQWCLC